MICRRPLYCPICGQRVYVETDGAMPEVHILPDHFPCDAVNLCQGYEIVVTIQLANCGSCGRKMAKHPSGVCIDCYRYEHEPVNMESA